MQEQADLTNPESRLRGKDLLSDQAGRSFDRKGAGRHAMESKTDVKKQAAVRFAQEICSYLEANRNRYDKLILIAPPAFLGILRDNLPELLPRLLVNELDKDIVRWNARKIQQYLKL